MSGIALIIIIALGLIVYFLPFLLSKDHNSLSVFLVNLFFGWSIIGWIVAFIMALSAPRTTIVQTAGETVSNADELQKIIALKEAGSINEKEFKTMKAKLIQ